jgi:hypothetical protein
VAEAIKVGESEVDAQGVGPDIHVLIGPVADASGLALGIVAFEEIFQAVDGS